MAITTQPERVFDVAVSSADGRIRVIRSDTGRVALALSVGEASQIRSALKGALQPKVKKAKRAKKVKKH